jgi:hypothetical protein
MISDKGMVKKVNVKYFGGPARRGSLKDQGSMMTLDPTDSMRFVSGMQKNQNVGVALRNGVVYIDGDDIPDQTKKSKGKKMLSPSGNINIVVATVFDKK